MQWTANPPMYLSASVGSNPTTSVWQYSSVWQSTGLICLWSIVQIYLLPCVVSLVVRQWFVESPRWVQFPYGTPLRNRLIGWTTPFEGVYLGSSPSFSASRVGVIGNILVSKTKVQSSSL